MPKYTFLYAECTEMCILVTRTDDFDMLNDSISFLVLWIIPLFPVDKVLGNPILYSYKLGMAVKYRTDCQLSIRNPAYFVAII